MREGGQAPSLKLPPPLFSYTRSHAGHTVESLGITFTHAPVEDFEAPTLAQAQALTRQLLDLLRQDRRVLLHCQAGLGRAGTIAACVLVASRGLSAEGAIAYIRWLRHGAVQSEAQEKLIARFASSA